MHVLELLSECFLETKDYTSAIKYANLLVKRDRKKPYGYFLLGKGHLKNKDPSDAADAFSTSIDLCKGSSREDKNLLHDAIGYRIDALFESGEHNEAANVLNDALSIAGCDNNLYFLLAYANVALTYGKMEEATRCLLKAIVVDQTNRRAREMTVRLLLSETGLSQVQAQLVPDSSSAAAYALFATFAKDVSEMKLAADMYDFSLHLIEKSQPTILKFGPSYILNLAHVLEATYAYAESLDSISRFLKSNPGESLLIYI